MIIKSLLRNISQIRKLSDEKRTDIKGKIISAIKQRRPAYLILYETRTKTKYFRKTSTVIETGV